MSGVLLAGGFVHLLGDSNKQFEDLGDDNFPWAFFVAATTIVGLVSLEIVLDRVLGDYLQCKHKNNKAEDSDSTTFLGDQSRDQYSIEETQEQEEPLIEQEHDDHHHGAHIDSENPFSALLLTIALSVHSIIEGLGIGASSDVSEIRSAFIAVAAHKAFVAFALANDLVRSGFWADRTKRKYFFISVGTFIFVSLLGIAIGWGINSDAEGSTGTAVLVSITAGSFIYVAIVEILPEETKTIKRERLMLLPVIFSFFAGFGLMSMLALWL